jgi:hypothetical protein
LKKFQDFVTQAFANLGPKSRAVTKAVRNRPIDSADEPRSGRVIPNQEVIGDLACRIETAYRLRSARWWGGCSTARVWDQGALYLWQAHIESPESIPLDAELYVASQDISSRFANPWFDVARPEAIGRYRSRVAQIVRTLRAELKREIGRAERAIRRGRAVQKVLNRRNRRLSPLGCYITALRADRPDLAERFTDAAALQHHACPLYRSASSALIPAEHYLFDRFPLARRGVRSQAAILLPTLN